MEEGMGQCLKPNIYSMSEKDSDDDTDLWWSVYLIAQLMQLNVLYINKHTIIEIGTLHNIIPAPIYTFPPTGNKNSNSKDITGVQKSGSIGIFPWMKFKRELSPHVTSACDTLRNV